MSCKIARDKDRPRFSACARVAASFFKIRYQVIKNAETDDFIRIDSEFCQETFHFLIVGYDPIRGKKYGLLLDIKTQFFGKSGIFLLFPAENLEIMNQENYFYAALLEGFDALCIKNGMQHRRKLYIQNVSLLQFSESSFP